MKFLECGKLCETLSQYNDHDDGDNFREEALKIKLRLVLRDCKARVSEKENLRRQ